MTLQFRRIKKSISLGPAAFRKYIPGVDTEFPARFPVKQ